jgi:glutamyl-tRNA(Gln) amidotransferase subunit E
MYEFTFKPFEEMTEEDYHQVGFKSGLEIHQQLLTEKKLFCRCPAGKYTHHYDAEILRHMRPTLSELGEYDGTALMEFKTRKNIIYRIKRETVCTYEMDDTPPFLMNDQALDIAIGLGILYECNIVDEIHIARKQYLDGSIPTGFQRTAIFALDGKVPYKGRDISIIQLSIEEDSCREVSDIGHRRVYLTDRLGMPLIETVTGPDMRTPFEVAEVANICSKLVRSTGMVRRGAGAAREDVNVSVTGGTRIEIKGVPKIDRIPLLTYNEAMRQWNLLRLREELNRRGITKDTFRAYDFDVTSQLKNVHYQPVKEALDKKLKVRCVVLKGFRDLLHWRTQTDTYFSREIADRVRVIACLTTIPNIIHSDSGGETLMSSQWQKIKKFTEATDQDTMVLVWGEKEDTDTAVKEIIIRAREATIGIPAETRQALSDGTNGFERILPGADRMYPDTDLPPMKVTTERVAKIKSFLPKHFWKREEWYKTLNIPKDVLEELSISRFAGLFETLVNEMQINPVLASVALIAYPKRLKKKGIDPELITEEMLRDIFKAYKEGILSRDGILPAIADSVKKSKFDLEMLLPKMNGEEFRNTLKECTHKVNLMKLYNEKNKNKLLMDFVMSKIGMKINGAEAAKQIGLIKEGK